MKKKEYTKCLVIILSTFQVDCESLLSFILQIYTLLPSEMFSKCTGEYIRLLNSPKWIILNKFIIGDSGMTYGTTIRDLCLRFNPHALRIDEHRLVQFGVLQGIIRRICKVSGCALFVILVFIHLFPGRRSRITHSH